MTNVNKNINTLDTVEIDSLRMRIPFDQVTVLNTDIVDRFGVYNADTGEELEEPKPRNWYRVEKNNKCGDKLYTYKWAIENNIAKEQARAVLPEGLTKSRLYMNGTIRSWIHFIELRSANGTQKECMEVAIECAKAITKIFPMIKEFYHE